MFIIKSGRMDMAAALPLAHNLMEDGAELRLLQPWCKLPQGPADQFGLGPAVQSKRRAIYVQKSELLIQQKERL